MNKTSAVRAGKAFVEIYADNSRLKAGLAESTAAVQRFSSQARGISS